MKCVSVTKRFVKPASDISMLSQSARYDGISTAEVK